MHVLQKMEIRVCQISLMILQVMNLRTPVLQLDEKYQTVQVRYLYYKKTLSSFKVKYVYNIKIEMVLPIFQKYASNIIY